MKRLPARPNLGQLKKQAKDLLTLLRNGDDEAGERLRAALPAAATRARDAAPRATFRLHDAQSCIAREYGFASWSELGAFVLAREAAACDPSSLLLRLWRLIYAGDIAGGTNRAEPSVALRLLDEHPALGRGDPYLACALGDEEAIARETERDPGWIDRPGGPLALPPLVAVTHSGLIQLAPYRERLRASASFLLRAGADPNASVANRWAASPDAPDPSSPLSALYGAAGQNRDPVLTEILLQHGADPNDGESLYHSLETPGCTRLLLQAGARIAGTNAVYRALDLDDIAPLRLLLAHGGDANERPPGSSPSCSGAPLLWAIRRRRSPAHVAALLAAGADPNAQTTRGQSAMALAQKFGLPEVARLLREAGADATPPSPADEFVAACARADEAAARRLLHHHPALLRELPERELSHLPDLAAEGASDAVRVMVRLGWPIDVRGGDWKASALNFAVFRGDAPLTLFLLEHGARWTEQHGFGDNVLGTLSWASRDRPVENGDWPGCAEALRAHGLPAAEPDARAPDAVVIDGVSRCFPEDVAEILYAAPATDG